MTRSDDREPQLFNSPLETGLRAVIVLDALYPRGCDLQEMTWLDHLVVHTADLANQSAIEPPSSLHPDLPGRIGEIVVRRRLVEESVRLMMQVNLVDVVHDDRGIHYVAGEDAPSFLATLQAEYTSELKVRAKWLADLVRDLPGDTLAGFVADKIGRWTAEFSMENVRRADAS